MNGRPHEVVSAFAREGLALNPRLAEMLDEHSSHRTERRGCGYTQATRFLSTYINQPRDSASATDLGLFADWPRRNTEVLASQAIAAGWAPGWRFLDRCPSGIVDVLQDRTTLELLVGLADGLSRIEQRVHLEESRILVDLIRQLLMPDQEGASSMAAMPEKPDIGSCSQAEEYFLEIAHGRIRRGGRVNVFVDDTGAPVLVEKMGLGESHSAMAVSPLLLCGVRLPPGSLFALRYEADLVPVRDTACGQVYPLSGVGLARFLRLTTLAVSPAARPRAFNAQFEAQLRNGLFSPATTTIHDLHAFALKRLGG